MMAQERVFVRDYPNGTKVIYADNDAISMTLGALQSEGEESPEIPEDVTDEELIALGFLPCEDERIRRDALSILANFMPDAPSPSVAEPQE